MTSSPRFYTQSGGLNIVCENFTVPANGTLATGIDMDKFQSARSITVTAGGEAVPVGTIDPGNTSTLDASTIDNSYTNLVYNNSSSGSAGDALPAIDLGTPKEIDSIRIYWWRPLIYGSNNYNIEASNDGTTWDVIASGLATTGTTDGSFDDTTVSGTYQYWRFRNITGRNATWVVIAEIEAFAVGVNQEILWTYTTDFLVNVNAGETELVNNTASDIEVRVCHL